MEGAGWVMRGAGEGALVPCFQLTRVSHPDVPAQTSLPPLEAELKWSRGCAQSMETAVQRVSHRAESEPTQPFSGL